MNRLFTYACCLMLAGCTTVGPVQKRAEQIRIPVADFQNASVADVIVFIVEKVNRPALPHVSLGLCQDTDQKSEEIRKSEFAKLYQICGGKTFSLKAQQCSSLDLLAFVASCAGLDTEFRDDHIVVVTKDGEVVAK